MLLPSSVGTRVIRKKEDRVVLALFAVGDVYVSLCKKSAYAPFSARRKSRVLF